MGMDRILKRLESPQPLRIGEFCRITGYDRKTVVKMIEAGAIATCGLTAERRIPIAEAQRHARALGIIERK